MTMAILVLLFLGISALVWLSTLGYLLAIGAAVLLKRQCGGGQGASPPIAIVIPTLNEEQTIAQKLDDIEQCDYPGDRRTLVVVDGGSTDKTPDLVQEKIAGGARITLVRLTESRGKVDQVNHALRHVKEGIIIFTDADSQLDRACVRALVRRLVDEPQTTLVGATVRPRSRLAEEHVHWCLLNYLWWLEGEVFSCAGLSGVCYGVNRNVLLALAEDAKAEDIHLGLVACAQGMRVRIARDAIAHELRVPQTVREFLQFRRRRGASYMNEVVHFPRPGEAPVRWRIARLIRLWQFAGVPWLGAAAVILSVPVLTTRYWPWVPGVGLAFFLPSFIHVAALLRRSADAPRSWALAPAVGRYLFLLLVSLMALNKRVDRLGAVGGQA
jgi:cellulose synthase/poly-beta-1,6-N-acetylglucosamine synthase-like glycosyltransferase